ncbi:hypothetical protein, partial [Salmonella sp. s29873]|uniref:hypothetical protein n=1 Tax=Salmonella sp. s29873 TaxID=3159634 RepID=UPI0039816D9B
ATFLLIEEEKTRRDSFRYSKKKTRQDTFLASAQRGPQKAWPSTLVSRWQNADEGGYSKTRRLYSWPLPLLPFPLRHPMRAQASPVKPVTLSRQVQNILELTPEVRKHVSTAA